MVVVGLPPGHLAGLAGVEGMGLALVEQVLLGKVTAVARVQTGTLVAVAEGPVLLGFLTEALET